MKDRRFTFSAHPPNGHLTWVACDTLVYHMPATASLRNLRNSFPQIRRQLAAEGEVLLTEGGQVKYRLTAYVPQPPRPPAPVDYWGRLTALQPQPLSAADSLALLQDNRGER